MSGEIVGYKVRRRELGDAPSSRSADGVVESRIADFKARHGLEAILAEAVAHALEQGVEDARTAIADFIKGRSPPANARDTAVRFSAGLKHKPPAFAYKDPRVAEQLPVLIKEIKLPFSSETHEIVYEPISRCVYVSQMTNSVLVRIPVGADGLMIDDQDS
ncbi:hypothetical protein M885DRAFT_500746 [Pelagophyceae sp. CCMP2097]|nr:hypothetical protein M885DRAFT_500746 [Pelagophyceae sp. CCMP2097]